MSTYDFANAVDRVKAIDDALKHYYGTENWLTIRGKLQLGIRKEDTMEDRIIRARLESWQSEPVGSGCPDGLDSGSHHIEP